LLMQPRLKFLWRAWALAWAKRGALGSAKLFTAVSARLSKEKDQLDYQRSKLSG
jgi:hypothetical protein